MLALQEGEGVTWDLPKGGVEVAEVVTEEERVPAEGVVAGAEVTHQFKIVSCIELHEETIYQCLRHRCVYATFTVLQ